MTQIGKNITKLICSFKLISSFESSFNKLSEKYSIKFKGILSSNAKGFKTLKHHNGFQITLLQDLVTQRYVSVANTHVLYFSSYTCFQLFWGGGFDYDLHYQLQSIQAYVIALEWKEFLDHNQVTDNVGKIICGDFNCSPKNGAYKLLQEGFLSKDFVDLCLNGRQNIEEDMKIELELKSCYSVDQEPLFTNFTKTFVGCLDYVFHSPKDFVVEKLVTIPSQDELSVQTALPSEFYPSEY
jgi:hypothetical protein